MTRLPRPASAATPVPVPAETAWTLVVDVRNHVRWIPLTRIEAAASLGVGETFTAVSGPGAARGGPGLVDRMRLERFEPPSTEVGRAGIAVYRKLGPVLLGSAGTRVAPTGPQSCVLTWTEYIRPRWLPPRLTVPLLRPLTSYMLRRALRLVAAELTATG